MTPKRQHVTLRPSPSVVAPWDERESDTGVSAMAFEGFDDEADTVTEQDALPRAERDANTNSATTRADALVDASRGET